jgi:hypothetical protein
MDFRGNERAQLANVPPDMAPRAERSASQTRQPPRAPALRQAPRRHGSVPAPPSRPRLSAPRASSGGGGDLPAALELLGLGALRLAKPTQEDIEALVAGKFSG